LAILNVGVARQKSRLRAWRLSNIVELSYYRSMYNILAIATVDPSVRLGLATNDIKY